MQTAFHHRVIWFVDALRVVRVQQSFGRPLAVAGHEASPTSAKDGVGEIVRFSTPGRTNLPRLGTLLRGDWDGLVATVRVPFRIAMVCAHVKGDGPRPAGRPARRTPQDYRRSPKTGKGSGVHKFNPQREQLPYIHLFMKKTLDVRVGANPARINGHRPRTHGINGRKCALANALCVAERECGGTRCTIGGFCKIIGDAYHRHSPKNLRIENVHGDA